MNGKQFLYIAAATLITVVVWVTLDISRSRSQVQVAQEIQTLLEPISIEFDQEAINAL